MSFLPFNHQSQPAHQEQERKEIQERLLDDCYLEGQDRDNHEEKHEEQESHAYENHPEPLVPVSPCHASPSPILWLLSLFLGNCPKRAYFTNLS